jgi:hypothetical protein
MTELEHPADGKRPFQIENDSSLGEKPNFPGDFQRLNLTIRDILGRKILQKALISNELKIIYKVFRAIYTPGG